MSITRKLLKGMGLTQEQEDTIIEAHTETVDSLKAERDQYKDDAAKLKQVQKELDKAKEDLEADGKDDWKGKYESIKKEYADYKADQKAKEEHGAKEAAYRELLKTVGVNEKHIDSVIKVSDVDGIKLDEDGKIDGEADLKKGLATEWAEFITTSTKEGASTPNPPANNGGTTMTRDEINKIKDPVERQNKIAENIDLYRKGE